MASLATNGELFGVGPLVSMLDVYPAFAGSAGIKQPNVTAVASACATEVIAGEVDVFN
ncbi:MAG: hypothetical protein AAFU85_18565 [Planctomycetota bacterium]